MSHASRGRVVAYSLAVILAGLAGRAAIDKMLASREGPQTVALWAQLQSVADLVTGVAMAGVGQGLTVLVAQSPAHSGPYHLLRTALRFGLGVSAIAMLAVVVCAGSLADRFTPDALAAGLVALAAVIGWAAVAPGLLSSYWLGRGRHDRILGLALATMLPMVATACFAPPGSLVSGVLLAQAAPVVSVSAAMLVWLRAIAQSASFAAGPETHLDTGRLLRYLPIGLSMGILSPASVLFARSTISDALSWNDAGIVQALWRSSEWITNLASGLLWLIFLPRFSAAHRAGRFTAELGRAALAILTGSAVLLLLLWLNQKQILAMLYDTRFAIPDRAAALFLLGDWLRIGSWVFLFALFAMQRTTPVVLGEFLSMPLFAFLLMVFSGDLTLERTGLLYAAVYFIYLAFNAAAVLRGAMR